MIDHETKMAAIKTGAVGAGFSLSSLTLNEWVQLATLIFIVMQIILLLPRYTRWFKKKDAYRRRRRIK